MLDTDHLSIIQRQIGRDYVNLSTRMAQYPLSEFTVSIVTLHEQLLGSHTYINRAHNSNEVVKGYEMMARIWKDFTTLPIVPFDRAAAIVFDRLQSQRIQLATFEIRCSNSLISEVVSILPRYAMSRLSYSLNHRVIFQHYFLLPSTLKELQALAYINRA
ncbi:MAG: type II toxin-antitoxin system VapC family toxin [Rhizonema sp. PD37]|nr:type II toxin-antitoxin system VapC family toxin [Rhizonema sp. PD37]